MKNMKRWMAALLMAMLLIQALPMRAVAQVGDPITQAELQQAFQVAGLTVSGGSLKSGGEESLPVLKASGRSSGSGSASVDPVESAYHDGMTPDTTWDAQTLADWADRILAMNLFSVNHSFSQVLTILERLETEQPLVYA